MVNCASLPPSLLLEKVPCPCPRPQQASTRSPWPLTLCEEENAHRTDFSASW